MHMTCVIIWICLLCVITDGNIIQHFALFFGESQSGKSSVINAISGDNVAFIGDGSGISVTKEPIVYVKSFVNKTQSNESIHGTSYNFKLYMMDTPGILDNRAIFSDQDILNTILYTLTEISVSEITAIFITESLSSDRIQLYRNLESLMEIFGESVTESIVVVGTKPLLGLQIHGEIRNEYVQNLCNDKNIHYVNYESTQGYEYKNQLKALMHAVFSVKPYKMDEVQTIQQQIEDRAQELMQNTPKREELIFVDKQITKNKTIEKQETYLDQKRGVVAVIRGDRKFHFFGPRKKTHIYGWIPVTKTRTITETVPYIVTEKAQQKVEIDHDLQSFINIAKKEWRERLKMRVYFRNETHDDVPKIESLQIKVLPSYEQEQEHATHTDDHDECRVVSAGLVAMEKDAYVDSIETMGRYHIIESTPHQFSVFAPNQHLMTDIPYVTVYGDDVNIYGQYAFNVSQQPAVILLDDGTAIAMKESNREYVTESRSFFPTNGIEIVSHEYDYNETFYRNVFCLYLFGKYFDPETYFEKLETETGITIDTVEWHCGSRTYPILVQEVLDLHINYMDKNIAKPIYHTMQHVLSNRNLMHCCIMLSMFLYQLCIYQSQKERMKPLYLIELDQSLPNNTKHKPQPKKCPIYGNTVKSEDHRDDKSQQSNGDDKSQHNRDYKNNKNNNNNKDNNNDDDEDEDKSDDAFRIISGSERGKCQREDCRDMRQMQGRIIRKYQLMLAQEIACNNMKPQRKKKLNKKRLAPKKHRFGYDPPPSMFRAQGIIKIESIKDIFAGIKEHIVCPRDYLDKSIAMLYAHADSVDKIISDNAVVLNLDLHDAETGDTVYFMITRIEADSSNYDWCLNKVFTEKQLEVQRLPRSASARLSIVFIEQLNYKHKVEDMLENNINNIFHRTKWTKIPVFHAINNKERMTLSLTQEDFLKTIKCYDPSMNSMEYKEEDATNQCLLIPFLMFDDFEPEFWIEYMIIISIKSNNIGISLKYNPHKKLEKKRKESMIDVKVTGIHMDKESICRQHQLVLPKHECHCLDAFESNISYLKIGEIDQDIRDKEKRDEDIRTLTEQLVKYQSLCDNLVYQSGSGSGAIYSNQYHNDYGLQPVGVLYRITAYNQ